MSQNRLMKAKAAIIGGTGVGDRLSELGGRAIAVPTSAGVMRGSLLPSGVVLLKRHSAGHKVPPHRVNYRAMALGLKALGVEACFASAAVGSLRPEWGPGTLMVPHDFLDLTCRNLTLFDRTVVHTDFSQPLPARQHLLTAAERLNLPVAPGGIYVGGNGPRYETPHEIVLYAKVGDVVGMTATTEAIVMREAGIAYGLLAVVTNLACGITEAPLSHEEVVDEMQRSGAKAVAILRDAAESV